MLVAGTIHPKRILTGSARPSSGPSASATVSPASSAAKGKFGFRMISSVRSLSRSRRAGAAASVVLVQPSLPAVRSRRKQGRPTSRRTDGLEEIIIIHSKGYGVGVAAESGRIIPEVARPRCLLNTCCAASRLHHARAIGEAFDCDNGGKKDGE
jgi:hypothetical protein